MTTSPTTPARRTAAADTREMTPLVHPLTWLDRFKPRLHGGGGSPEVYGWYGSAITPAIRLYGCWQPRVEDITIRANEERPLQAGFHVRSSMNSPAHGASFTDVTVDGTGNPDSDDKPIYAVATAYHCDARDENAEHNTFIRCDALNVKRAWAFTAANCYENVLFACRVMNADIGIGADGRQGGSFKALSFTAGNVGTVMQIPAPTRPCEFSGEIEHSGLLFDVGRGGDEFCLHLHDVFYGGTPKVVRPDGRVLLGRFGCPGGLLMQNISVPFDCVVEVFVPRDERGKPTKRPDEVATLVNCNRIEVIEGQW